MNDFSDKTVLVTGGTGFIGGRIVERLVLEHKARVRVLVRNFGRASRIARFNVEMIAGDITSREDVEKAVAGCDIIFHCAYGNYGDAEMQRRVNVDGTENIILAAKHFGTSRIVHTSTISVYESQLEGELDETSPKNYSGDPYTDTKLDGEHVALNYAQNYQMPISIIQPTIVYGPWAPSWTIRLLKQIYANRIVLVNGGDGLCNAVYIDDVVQAMFLAAIKEEAIGQTFIISAKEPVTWREFYTAYAQMLGVFPFVEMSLEEIQHYQKNHTGSFARMIQTYRQNQDLRHRIHQLPGISHALRFLHQCLSDDGWEAWKQKILGEQTMNSPTDTNDVHPLLVPSVDVTSFLASKVQVHIDKAVNMLDYIPRFTLARGMDITEQWAKWANLA